MHNLLYKIFNKTVFLLLVACMSLLSVTAYAQKTTGSDFELNGVVVDQWGTPISKASVLKNGVGLAVSDSLGKFTIRCKVGDELSLSHPDFMLKSVKIDSRAEKKRIYKITINQTFIPAKNYIDLAYRQTDKQSYLGSASTIYSNQLTTTLSSTIIPALAGRLAGLNVSQNSGFRARNVGRNNTSAIGGWIPNFGGGRYSDNSQFGLSSRNNAPVVMIDGIQRELFAIDPESIESVSIQKDALSSLMLGMKSSRGVLVITTKKPIKEGFQLSFTAKYGVQSAIKMPKPLSSFQYAYLLNEALQNDAKSPVYSYDDFQAYKNGASPYTHPDVNWYDQVLKDNAAIQSYNLNVTGGGKVAQYFVSLGYFGEDGVFRSDKSNSYNTNLENERYLITSKVNVNITKSLKAAITVMGRIEDGNQPGAGYSSLLNDIFTTPNNAYPVLNPNGSYGGTSTYTTNLYAQALQSGYISDNARDVLANIKLSYDFSDYVKGLSLSGMGNVASQSRSAIVRTKKSSVYQYKPAANGKAESYDVYGQMVSQSNNFDPVSTYQYVYGQVALEYDRTFSDHSVRGLLQADMGNSVNNYDLPNKPSNIIASGSYDYQKRYFAQLAYTRSHYNGYHPDRQWGSFYAAGLGWELSNENFLKDVNWLNQLKLRGVYGKTGNGIDNTGYYTWRQSFGGNGQGVYELGEQRSGGGQGVSENNPLANPYLTWEKAYKLNVGLDAAFFDNKLTFTADYYNDKYFDLLQQRGKSIEIIGHNYPSENIGKVRQSGLELSFTYQNNAGKFNYFVTGTWGLNKSKLLFIDEQDVREEYNRKTGKSASMMLGLIADGFFTSMEEIAKSAKPEEQTVIRPGDIKYRDLNNDGVINDFDRTTIGGDKPYCTFGINAGFEFHGIEFSMLWQGAYNREIYLGDNVYMSGFQSKGQNYGQAYQHMLGRWTPETANTATFPRLTAGGNTYNTKYSSFWVRSGNYIRLKNVSLAYNIPETVSRNFLGGVRLKVFINADNIFTQSACDLVDPEVNFTSYPLMRCINAGINIKF